MSTKTTFKRISLVAVAALALGGLSVVPASASAATATLTGAATVYGTVGVAAPTSLVAGYTNTTGSTSTSTVTFTIAKPTGSTAVPTFGASTATTSAATTWTPSGTGGVLASTTAAANGATTVTFPVSITPDIAGTYTISVTNTVPADNSAVVVVYTLKAAGLAYLTGDGAAVSPATTGNGIAGPANTVTVNATTNAANNRALVTVSGAGATINTLVTTVLAAGATSGIIGASTADQAVIINTPTAGTIIVSQFYESGNGTGIYASTASKTVTITVGTAAVNGTLSVANSTSIIDGTIGTDNEAWSTITVDEKPVVTAVASASLERAVIKVVLKDSLNNVMPNATGISAVVTGPGLLAIGTTQETASLGRAVTSSTLASGTGTAFISVYSDGTPGIGIITISSGTTVIATETVTFTGLAASYTVAQNSFVYQISGSGPSTPTAQTISVTVKDAAGNLVADNITVYATSATTATATVTATATTATGVASFTVTGVAAGTSVITFGNAATAATVTATTTVTVGSATVAAITLTTDKTSYLPGERVVLTISATSADGKPVADGTYTLYSTYPTSTMALSAGTLPTSSTALVAGKNDLVLNAPLAVGTFTISGKSSLTGTPVITVTATADGDTAALDAAAEATDAANAATDAANAAAEAADAATAAAQDAADAVAALATQVATYISNLRKQITALTNLVIKIQKKVKA